MEVDYQILKSFRRELHQYPEVSGDEKQTAERVLEFLKKCRPDKLIHHIGGHGIYALFDSGVEGKTLFFRSELDALPITEINTFEYKSMHDGVSHKCGHDGHASILCGLAAHLSENKPKTGKVYLVFQGAEENGEGAAAMLADDKFKEIKADYVFALHNLPAYPLGQIVLKENTFTASVTSIIIKLIGKTAHAAEPENGYNPAACLAEIVQKSLALANNNPESDDLSVVTPVYMKMGELAYGISAGDGELHLTIRCWDDQRLQKLEQSIMKEAEDSAIKHKLNVDFSFTQTFHANMNHKEALEKVRTAAEENNYNILNKKYPFKWGEDFGLFTAKFKGCMFGLGAGENLPALHNPDYDFPDELIQYGVQMFSSVINQTLNK